MAALVGCSSGANLFGPRTAKRAPNPYSAAQDPYSVAKDPNCVAKDNVPRAYPKPGEEHVRQVNYESPGPVFNPPRNSTPPPTQIQPPQEDQSQVPPREAIGTGVSQNQEASQTQTIDLAQALALGGANHLQIKLARERVIEAHANLSRARAMWLPSLRAGVGWNKHDGRLQQTEGDVLEINRNSLFVGGGAGLGNAPLAAGAGGPPRFFVNLSLADAIFQPRVKARKLAAASAGEAATMNNSLMQIAIAYFNLVEAHSELANANQGYAWSSEMVKLTRLFFDEMAGSRATVDLAETEQAMWIQRAQDADRRTVVRSAELARLLRLDPSIPLVPADVQALPIHLVDPGTPLEELLAGGMAARPELSQVQSLHASSIEQWRGDRWRPWIPNVQAGASAGTFGGGPSSRFENQSSRSDVDLLAVWELENLALGTMARQRQSASQVRQAELSSQWVRDRVATEIVTASTNVNSYLQQIDTAMKSVSTASKSYDRNYERVKAAEGLPVELLQAIRARAGALDAYTRAVGNYNRSQVELLRAIGRPPKTG